MVLGSIVLAEISDVSEPHNSPIIDDTPTQQMGAAMLSELMKQAASEQIDGCQNILRRFQGSRLAKALMQDTRTRLENGVAESPLKVLRDCQPGCTACCYAVSVDITPLEALSVAAHLRSHFEGASLERIQLRLAARVEQLRSHTPEERTKLRTPCALLSEEGLCEVYESRPLACAGCFSLSREACERGAASTEDSSDPALAVPMDRPARSWTMGVSGGLQHALVQAGLDGNLYELQSAVLRAIEVPDALQRWLNREDVFAECICTDAHSHPRKPKRNIRIDAGHSGKLKKPSLVKDRRKQKKLSRRAKRLPR